MPSLRFNVAALELDVIAVDSSVNTVIKLNYTVGICGDYFAGL